MQRKECASKVEDERRFLFVLIDVAFSTRKETQQTVPNVIGLEGICVCGCYASVEGGIVFQVTLIPRVGLSS